VRAHAMLELAGARSEVMWLPIGGWIIGVVGNWDWEEDVGPASGLACEEC
jgi:hypothetical protein